MKVFQVCVVHRPSDERQRPRIVLPSTEVLAKDKEHAIIEACKRLGSDDVASDRTDELEVLVRPFA